MFRVTYISLYPRDPEYYLEENPIVRHFKTFRNSVAHARKIKFNKMFCNVKLVQVIGTWYGGLLEVEVDRSGEI